MSDQSSDPSRPFDPPVPPTAPPAPPQAPPAPPAAPEPPRPEVPKYGEYAENVYGVPGYPAASAAPAAPPVAPGMPAYSASGAPMYVAPARKRRTWDVVLTSILLVLGFFGMLLGLVYAAIFGDPVLLSKTMESQGYGTFTGTAGAVPAVIVISHVVLYLLALGLSIPLLVRGRVVVFWIPLTIGVIAAIMFWVSLISVFLADPGFTSKYGG